MPLRTATYESHQSTRVRTCAWVLGLVMAVSPFPGHASPPAGTPIDNTASATAQDALTGAWMTPVSNTVRAVVQAHEAVALTGGRERFAPHGGSVTFAHTLANRGNTAIPFTLTLTQLGADDFDAAPLTVVHDVGRDGIADLTDPVVPDGGTLVIARADSVQLLVTATVPMSAPAWGVSRFTLGADAPSSVHATATDSVRTDAPPLPPALAFWSSGYAARLRSSALGAPLYLQAEAPQCNLRPGVADTVTLALSSRLTGDTETFIAVETDLNTGVFRLPGAPVTTSPPVTANGNDGVLQQSRGDEVTAVLSGCGSVETRATLLIQPSGQVFDARANTGVAGARVQLVDLTGAGNGGDPGGLARVLGWDGASAASADVTTDADGRFEFPSVRASQYRLVVTPPASHQFPSLVPYASLPAGHALDVTGSYGGAFALAEDGLPVALDMPVDAIVATALFAEKTASRTQVEWGDELDYTVRVANASDTALTAVSLVDQLPAGFTYVRGTATLDGTHIANDGGAGPVLTFALGNMATHAQAELRYRVRVGPGTPQGDALNQAVAASGATRSNVASARVRVRGDALADEALLVGSVWFDADRNGVRSADEPGLAGVRLYLDDGSFAVTDAQGRYSLAALSPRTHALKVDPTTLPGLARLTPLGARDAATPGLRFVDLSRGDMVRADFAAVGDTTALREAGDRALASARRGTDERSRALSRGLDPLVRVPSPVDERTLPAARIVTGEVSLPVSSSVNVLADALAPVPPPVGTSPAVALDQVVGTLDSDLGFVGLADLDTVGINQLAVVVKGRFGSSLSLRVNGELIPEARVGRHFAAPRQNVEAWEYIGIALQPGVNVLEVSPPHTTGRVALRVVAPGPLARLELDAPRAVPADGHSIASLRLRVTDALGVRVSARTLVTLDAPEGRLRAADLDPVTPGVQVAVDGGETRVALVAAGDPGQTIVTATSGLLRASAAVTFVPELRPLLAVGAFEGVVSLRRFGAGRSPRSAREASFEAPITQFATESRDGRATAAAHGALFMKGRLRDALLLTLGWDSDRPAQSRQFRDQQPDRGFPLAGDAATRGYEAQSTGQLYARLEQRDAYVGYGDFVTGSAAARTLGRYSRSLTGLSSQWHRGAAQFDAFTSRERGRRVVEELRGAGTSGPYVLARTPLVENSERIEIVVRDRTQPSVILSSTERTRFTDYEVEAWTGRVLFRSPVPSVDANLNPVFVRVSYELAEGGAPAWVHGVEGRVALSPRVEVGGSYVDDHDPAAPYELRSASGLLRLAPRTTLEAEWAATRRTLLTSDAAQAGRVEFKHESARGAARVWGVSTARAFDNPAAGFGAGRNEAGATFSTRLPDRSRLAAEALFSADAQGHERRGGGLITLDRALSSAVRGELGVRLSGAARRAAASELFSAALRGKLTGQWPSHPAWSGYGELEQDTREFDRRMAALGGEYRFTTRGRLYARHELVSSLTSAWALSSTQRQAATVAGVDADVAGDAHLFSEYRMSGALAGREAQAAVGLRNGWRLASGMRVGTSFERVTPLEGNSAGPSTALTGSVDFVDDPVWKGSSRAEIRTSRASDQFLQGMAAAVRLDSAWTGLGRHLLTVTHPHGRGGEARERLQLAFAWRDGAAWDALGRWELRYDREAALLGARTRRVANIASFAGTGRSGEWESSLAWAGKLTREQSAGLVTAGGAQWLHGRVRREWERTWDVGASASVLAGRRIAQRQYGLGIELGRQLPGGAWLSLGWNRFGYADDELTGEEWTRQGASLRVRVKLDETWLRNPGAAR